MKVSLYSNNETDGILFNFHETIYQIQVDLLAGFSTTVDVKTKDNHEQNGLLDLVPGFFDEPYFVAKYQVVDKEYGYELYKTDCKTRLSPADAFPLYSSTDSVTDGVKDVELRLFYNQTLLESSNLFDSTDSTLNFCLRLILFTTITNRERKLNTLVQNKRELSTTFHNFIDTTYSIVTNASDPFSSTVSLEATSTTGFGLMAINFEENITAYQCDDNFDVLTSIPALTQGDSLQICVETEDGSAFEVGGIKDVTVDQNGTKSFDYVSSFVDSYWSKSSCVSTKTFAAKCKVRMQLLGAYFMDDNPNDLTVTGFVKMDYLGGAGRRRHLLLEHEMEEEYGTDVTINQRNLQGISGSAFTLDVGLANSGSSASSGTTSTPEDIATNGEDVGFPVEKEYSGIPGQGFKFGDAILFSLIALFSSSLYLIAHPTN